MASPSSRGSVALVTLGCTRNEVDSEELAGRLAAEGWTLVDDAAQADVAVVNTCGFVEQAKKDSIDALLEASDLKGDGGRTQKVVAVGCLAERYGKELAVQLPEADAVLGFDSYRDMSAHLQTILAGGHVESHTPGDRRTLLPLTPARRQQHAASVALPGHGDAVADLADEDVPTPASGPRVIRARLDGRRGRRSRSPLDATGAARSAPSRCSGGRSCPGGPPTSSPRVAGLPSRASRSSSSSPRTPRAMARTSATSPCSRSCCPS